MYQKGFSVLFKRRMFPGRIMGSSEGGWQSGWITENTTQTSSWGVKIIPKTNGGATFCMLWTRKLMAAALKEVASGSFVRIWGMFSCGESTLFPFCTRKTTTAHTERKAPRGFDRIYNQFPCTHTHIRRLHGHHPHFFTDFQFHTHETQRAEMLQLSQSQRRGFFF